jgi:hypothetical protein
MSLHSAAAAILALLLALAAFGKPAAALSEQQAGGETAAQFDARDFSGIWLLRRNSETIGPNQPPMTPAGIEAMRGRIPESTVRVPGESNDPIRQCNPNGFPRLLFDAEPIEFVHTRDRLYQFFQWERQFREIWLDGRPLPSGENLENLGPAWYGHSVAEWQGDTLVVNTVGLNEQAWLDEEKGRPKSFHARIEERYRRTDADTIEVQLTMYDPEYYTATWAGDTKTFRRMAPETYTYFGWKGLFGGITDAICAPMNEVEGYNKRFRDPAEHGVKP